VNFTVTQGKSGPEATCTQQHQSHGANGRVYRGTIKSFVPDKGWGLIESAEISAEFGKDMFVMRSSLPNGYAEKGAFVRFSVAQGAKGPEAIHVEFAAPPGKGGWHVTPPVAHSNVPRQPAGYGPHSQWGGPVFVPIAHSSNVPMLPERMLLSHHAGVVKSFNEAKGWGFIVPSSAQLGGDLFVMRSALSPETNLKPGDHVQFKITKGKKGYEAKEVHVVPNLQELAGQTYSGVIKSYNEVKGWGFIESDAATEMLGRDIFFHKRDLGDRTPSSGEEVQFSVGQNKGGHPQAKNLVFMHTDYQGVSGRGGLAGRVSPY
jgi:CspA family cold shock protein